MHPPIPLFGKFTAAPCLTPVGSLVQVRLCGPVSTRGRAPPTARLHSASPVQLRTACQNPPPPGRTTFQCPHTTWPGARGSLQLVPLGGEVLFQGRPVNVSSHFIGPCWVECLSPNQSGWPEGLHRRILFGPGSKEQLIPPQRRLKREYPKEKAGPGWKEASGCLERAMFAHSLLLPEAENSRQIRFHLQELLAGSSKLRKPASLPSSSSWRCGLGQGLSLLSCGEGPRPEPVSTEDPCCRFNVNSRPQFGNSVRGGKLTGDTARLWNGKGETPQVWVAAPAREVQFSMETESVAA